MAFPQWFFLLVFLLGSGIPFCKAYTPDHSTQALVDKICSTTEDVQFCNLVINFNLESPHADIKTLTRITTLEALINATRSHEFVRVRIPNLPTPELKIGFSKCAEAFGMVKLEESTALDALYRNQYQDVLQCQVGTKLFVNMCWHAFKVGERRHHPLWLVNWQLNVLANMSLTAARILLP